MSFPSAAFPLHTRGSSAPVCEHGKWESEISYIPLSPEILSLSNSELKNAVEQFPEQELNYGSKPGISSEKTTPATARLSSRGRKRPRKVCRSSSPTRCAMTAAVAKRMCRYTHGSGHSEEVTLPCIVDRLSRLENEGFSYDELLHDFASRRRVGPVNEELSEKHVIDPAEETDEIVQVRETMYIWWCSAYVHLHDLCLLDESARYMCRPTI